MWNYSLAGWGKVAVINIVIVFKNGSPCFFFFKIHGEIQIICHEI